MKKKMIAFLFAAMLAVLPVSQTVYVCAEETAAAYTEMPAPFYDDGDAVFYQPCGRLDMIPSSLLSLAAEDEVDSWMMYHSILQTDIPSSLMAYPNIYSFIKVFGISEESVTAAMSSENVLTTEELTLILSGTEAEILAHFATEYTIVIGDRCYSPQWVYEKSVSEYAQVGITPEVLTEKIPYYESLALTEEAAEAFFGKLSGYISQTSQPDSTDPTEPLEPETPLVPTLRGDVNLDGIISVMDVVMLQKYLLGAYTLDYEQVAAADMDANAIVNVYDLGYLKREVISYQPTEKIVDLPVITYNQNPDYPTGCESIALYMLLQYYHTDVTPDQIVDALPKGPLPYEQNGVLYGANPEKEFVGDPRTSYSYGVFNVPVAQTAELFRSGVITKTGAALSEIISILDTGNPVLVWYTMSPDAGIYYKREWYDYETGELIRWPANEHAVVVCGHDAENLTYRDPYTGGSRTMTQSKFQETFDEIGGRIIYYQN